MAIEFDGQVNEFSGTHESLEYDAPHLQSVRSEFSGVIGESEIRQGAKGRTITCRIMLHGKYGTSQALHDAVVGLNLLVGDHGELRTFKGPYGGTDGTFPNCTFEGFAKEPGNMNGPLPDMTGLLDGAIPSWWVWGILTWRQLSLSQAQG